MEDRQIIALFFARSESALQESAQKYAAYCRTVAMHILHNHEDADEALNDTWLAAWNCIPPHEPSNLQTFLGRLTRNIALKRVRSDRAQKRGTPELRMVFDEIADLLRSDEDIEQKITEHAVTETINAFLASLPETERNIFVRRYYYMQPIAEITAAHGFSQSKVKSMLLRIRKKLHTKLKKEELL